MASIYGIVDPRDGQLRYVGKTTGSIRRRFLRHLREKGRTPKCLWLRKMADLQLQPTVVLLSDCDTEIINQAEVFWIDYYRSLGFPLLNLTPGGEGGRTSEPSLQAVRRGGPTLEEQQEICTKYLQGRGSHELAKEYGVGHQSVLKTLNRNAVARRDKYVCQGGLPISCWAGIQGDYLKGSTGRELARKYKVSTPTIYKILKRLGTTIRAPNSVSPVSAEMATIIAAQYLAGASIQSLSRRHGFSPSCIGSILNRHSVSRRLPGRPRKTQNL